MTASADKVQFLLQASLQQTLPLVKKGIFTQQQLRQVMLERQKHQNKLYSTTFKLSHYLKAIEFEYDLERQRQFRIKNYQEGENANPMFKKQGKTDFSIIKRILKLWDRTMHKYRFRLHLWKQYLAFCIAIKSKKHFYKALTNALRFLPFELELWKIGVRYEVEIGRNLWKARKLFHKGLKLVPSGQKNIDLTKELIKFELEFVQMLEKREKIIKGQSLEQQQQGMKFIMGDNHQKEQSQQQSQNSAPLLPYQGSSQLLKLRSYHQVLYIALTDSIQKNYKSLTYFRNKQHLSPQQRSQILCDIYLQFFNDLLQEEQNQLIEHILKVTYEKLESYRKELGGIKLENGLEEEDMEVEENVLQDGEEKEEEENLNVQQEEQLQIGIEVEEEVMTQQPVRELSKEQKLSNEMLQKYKQTGQFDQKLFTKSIKQLCLKPLPLSSFLQPLIPHFLPQSLQVLKTNQWLRIPLKSLQKILTQLNTTKTPINPHQYSSYMTKQFQKINPTQYMANTQLLRQVIQFNKSMGKVEDNNKLYRSILVNCKQNVEFVERAKALFLE